MVLLLLGYESSILGTRNTAPYTAIILMHITRLKQQHTKPAWCLGSELSFY